ncbi:DUF2273 domain-containing protein [Collinsella provencensis]|uniref:DUF2273 domain-containing protein n=1 Tax=Collinsella provencensis TaxID=1937461 RepID=UPI000C853E21|nr:DUF2273 domain-containing protein [Collinsella provencensis]
MSENAHDARKAPKAIIEPTLVVETPSYEEPGQGTNSESSDTKKGAGSKTGSFQTATIGFFEGVGRVAWAYADAHPHATLYGILGFVLAVLILIIGLWRTLVIAVFVGVGAAIGHMMDDKGPRGGSAGNFLNRIINGK